MVYDPQSPSEHFILWPRAPGARLLSLGRAWSSRSIACAAPIFHLIRPSFSSPGSLAAFKLSHKIYLLFHEYISSRQAQAFYIFTLYIFHGRLIAVSKAERGRGEERADGTGSWWQREGGKKEAQGTELEPRCPWPHLAQSGGLRLPGQARVLLLGKQRQGRRPGP